jgi:hypothetical protein
MGFGHENLDVYRTSIEYVGWAYRCDADETRVTRLHRCEDQPQYTVGTIPIPTPTPMGPRSRRIANNWLGCVPYGKLTRFGV